MTIEYIKKLAKEMCDLRRQGKFVPILEADLSGLLFHLMATKRKLPLPTVHLDTRVIGAGNNNQRFDLVIGEVVERQGGSPAVCPQGIIEIKMFPEGFTAQEHSVHFKDILERDLPKFSSLQTQAAMKVEFIFDEVDYLSRKYRGQIRDGKYKGKTKESVIVAERNKVARGVNIVFARKINRKWDVWVKSEVIP